MRVSRRSILGSFAASAAPAPRLKLLVAGGHPGDPECGCGGTIARYTALGHQAVLLYLNRGEGYCKGGGDCSTIRTAEAHTACRILKARAVFATQYDGRSIVDNPHYDEFHRLLDAEKPDIVFAHWPLDRHRDHRALSNLVLDSWLRSSKRAALYFYEVAEDTMMFSPTEFVDISAVESERRAACHAHASQQPDKWYPKQVELTRRRGADSGVAQAEAFLRHWESRRAPLLP
jgi:N-acetylglucosamine malate deacetylase 1